MWNAIAKTLFLASVISFMISLFVPAFYDGKGAWPGGVALMLGVIGLFGRYYCWLANPLMVLVWIAALAKRPLLVICLALLACGLCLSFFLHHSIDHEEGPAPLVAMGPGFWLWLAAPLLMVLYGLLTLKKTHTANVALSD